MKIVVAFIRPAKEEAVREALHELPGLTGASFSDVRGFGRGRSHVHEEAIVGTGARVRVEVMVTDALAARVESAIANTAHTGLRGDGKIFILPLSEARRISTNETGDAAI